MQDSVKHDLYASNEELRKTLESIGDGFIACDAEWRFIYVNGMAERLLGMRREDLLGQTHWSVFPHVQGSTLESEFQRAAAGQLRDFEFHCAAWRRWFQLRCYPREGGGMIAYFRDISELKLREERDRRHQARLAEQQQELCTLLDTLPVGVLIAHDPQCHLLSGNRAVTRLLRMPANANLSVTSARLREQRLPYRVLSQGRELTQDELPLVRAARGERLRDEEYELRFDDGEQLQTLISAQPLLGEDGRPRGAVASFLDISELKRAARAISDTDQRKDEFLAVLAHELRNPLAPLRTGLDLLQLPGIPAGTSERALDMMQRQLTHLVRLVDDLLDLSRISRGKITLKPACIDLRAVINAAIDISLPLIEERQHSLYVDAPPEPLLVEGDHERLTQVLSNLLSNAARYTETGGSIQVNAERDGGDVRLSVKDSGRGIEADQQEEIFQMFSQLAENTRAGGQGLGIGLAISRQLVELHGGSIEVHSEGRDRGSEFVIRLPLRAEDLEVDGEDGAGPRPASDSRLVLVVDDNLDAARSLSLLLELQGHRVETVHDGQAALDILEGLEPDLVLLDIGLPRLNGYEVARRIRARPGGANLRLVAVTGWGQDEDKERALEAGFDEHVTKPIGNEVLARILQIAPRRAG